MTGRRSSSTAEIHVLDGGLSPDEEKQAPLRRVELAAIWLAEAAAELHEAIIAAKDAGAAYPEIGAAAGVSGEAVRLRYVRSKRENDGGSV